jgi:hypothetical protein
VNSLAELEHGTDLFNMVFRNYMYLFTDRNQSTLYTYGYFIIKWINTLIKENKNIVYYIPKNILDVPYEILKVLIKLRSPVLYDSNIRKEANKLSKHFSDDNFLYEIVCLYTYLFNDQKIANPEIRESLISKIGFFMKNNITAILYEENIDLVEYLIKGLLEYMSIESISHHACDIMVKIVKPICFGQTNVIKGKKRLVEITKKFFENNLQTFSDFMNNYTKLINKIMTEYTLVLNDAAKVKYSNLAIH